MQKLAGIIIIIGTAVAIWGEGRPVMSEVYGTSDMPTQLAAIAADPSGWSTALTLMALGGIVVALGLILLAVQVQRLDVAQRIKTADYAGGALVMLGALLHAVERYNQNSAWETYEGIPFPFPLLWIAGLVLFGLVMLWSAYSNWLGWVLIVASVLLLAGLIVGFLPPVLIYFPLVPVAIALLIKSTPQSVSSEPSASMA
jgi:hypothetical protein